MRTLFGTLLLMAGCTGTAWNTEVANTPAARDEIARSVIPGTTTETAMVTRWGYPTQKIKDGAQTEFIYRDMRNPPGYIAPQFGDSQRYVIVTFQYGLATGVRTSDGIPCRGTFVPRPPGYGYGNPGTHRLAGSCPNEGLYAGGPVAPDTGRPGVSADVYVSDGKLPK